MSLEGMINGLVSVTLIEMMASIGLGVTFAEVKSVAKDWKAVARALFANYVCVPAAAVALLWLFRAQPMVAAGFLIISVCPGAPYGPPFTGLAKGNVGVAVGLMVILAGSSAVLAPVLLSCLLPVMTGNDSLRVDAVKMTGTLLLTQLIPLLAGLLVRQWRPSLATKLQKPANRLCTILNLATLVLIVTVQYRTLTEIRPFALVGMSALLISTLVIGWLLGGGRRDDRTAMALATSVRNVGVGLVVATGSFAGTAAVTAALAYGLFQTVIMALVAVGWGRRGAAKEALSGAGVA